jgi:hypothetical protein
MAQISMKQNEKLDGVIELLSLQQAQLTNIDNQLELLTRMCNENANALNVLEGELEEIKIKL